MKKTFHHFTILTSTNDWAKQHFDSFEEETLTIVWADQQTRGKGQFGRYWLSPAKQNLYCSLCFFVNEKQDAFDSLSFTHLLALAVFSLLKNYGVTCQLKWPNDILVKEKKIAGILCETLSYPEKTGIVLGIGLNIFMPLSLLYTIDQPATSLMHETKKNFQISEILDLLTCNFERQIDFFAKNGFPSFIEEYAPLFQSVNSSKLGTTTSPG